MKELTFDVGTQHSPTDRSTGRAVVKLRIEETLSRKCRKPYSERESVEYNLDSVNSSVLQTDIKTHYYVQ